VGVDALTLDLPRAADAALVLRAAVVEAAGDGALVVVRAHVVVDALALHPSTLDAGEGLDAVLVEAAVLLALLAVGALVFVDAAALGLPFAVDAAFELRAAAVRAAGGGALVAFDAAFGRWGRLRRCVLRSVVAAGGEETDEEE